MHSQSAANVDVKVVNATDDRNKPDESNQAKQTLLDVATRIIKNLTVCVGVVMYWRGSWYLMDFSAEYLHLHGVAQDSIQSFTIGLMIPLLITLIWFWIPKSVLVVDTKTCSNGIARKTLQYLLVLLLAFTTVAFWRGVWYFCDYVLFADNMPLSFSLSIGIGLIILLSLQSWSSLLAPPIVFLSDKDDAAYSQFCDIAYTLRNLYSHYVTHDESNIDMHVMH
mmetsp:Transcript_58555/g.93094  ORF Transcript_58555/g.93094 Transcript_58555/m.93094 type:complete len:223 (-) Transcript_58555:71-739(-)